MIGREAVGIADQAIADVVPPLVRDDAIVERAVAVDADRATQAGVNGRRQGELRFDGSAFALRNLQRGNGDRGVGTAHPGGCTGDVGHHNHTNRTGSLRVFYLDGEPASAAINQRNLANERGCIGQWRRTTAIGWHRCDHVARQVKRLRAKARRRAELITRNRGRRVDGGDLCSETVEHIHTHARTPTVGGSAHIGIVDRRKVLRFGIDRVTCRATSPEVIALGITGRFVEARVVIPIMQKIVHVEQIGDRGHDLIV